MSTYRSSTTSFSVGLIRGTAVAASQFAAVGAGITSRALRAHAGQPARLMAEVPGLAASLPELAAIVRDDRIRPAEVEAEVEAIAGQLAAAERQVIVETAQDSLQALGYTHVVAHGSGLSAIEAWRGQELLLLTIPDGGDGVEADHAGLADTTCLQTQQELEDEMAARGVHLQATRRVDHVSERGGNLIGLAAQNTPGNLARGAVQNHENVQKAAGQLFEPRRRRETRKESW